MLLLLPLFLLVLIVLVARRIGRGRGYHPAGVAALAAILAALATAGGWWIFR